MRDAFVVIALVLAPAVAVADEASVFFDDSVKEIRLSFADPNWWDVLYTSHDSDPADPYFPARFSSDGVDFDPVGVRFKGDSSFWWDSPKKSFKIDFDEYDEDNPDLQFHGLTKLNLNNGYSDPTFLREVLFYEFARRFVAAPRTTFVRLYVNDELWGLYIAVEQVGKRFVRSRFGGAEDGNLFKAHRSEGGDPADEYGADLTWLGPDPAEYHRFYQLKTNETADDYSQFIEFIDVLNNSDPATFPTVLEPIFDVDVALTALALNNLLIHLDSYLSIAHNYYIYDRDDSGQLTHIHWDTNLSYGRLTLGIPFGDDPLELSPFWLPEPFFGQPQERPLMENLWANPDYETAYLCQFERLLGSGFDAVTMQARVTELADLIRDSVYEDANKQYTDAEFETCLTDDVVVPGFPFPETIYGLVSFVERRAAFMTADLAARGLSCPARSSGLTGSLFVNEFMADNDTTLQDPAGTGYPDWFELYNAGPTDANLRGLYLTDDVLAPTRVQITDDLIIPSGGHMLFYADNDADQGPTHVEFKLSAAGETLAIFDLDGATPIDVYTFGPQTTDQSEARCPDGSDNWQFPGTATPGSTNGDCSGCPAGVPGRIDDLTLTRSDRDIDLYFGREPAAGGFHLYRTDDKTLVGELRMDRAYVPIAQFDASEPAPVVLAGGVDAGADASYFQVLGACADDVTEGPN